MLLHLLWLVLLVALAGCRLLDPAADSPRPEPTPGATQASAGLLAYVGGDGNVYVTSPGGPTSAITSDAETAAEGSGLSYHRLSWSRDGRLAFASVDRSGDMARSKLFVNDLPDGPALLVGESDEHFVIYAFWSPVPCPGRDGCQQLAYLIEESDDIALRLVELQAQGQPVENRRIGHGWPFYYSWSPDGRSILWHSGYARRENPFAQLVHYDLQRDRTRIFASEPGLFQAPAWSPLGEGWLWVAGASSRAEGHLDQLQHLVDDRTETLVAAPDGEIAFVWSPDGRQVAYAIRGGRELPFYGPIHLIDLASGETTRLTDVGFRILGFFWSPDGQRLAYLTWTNLRQETWSQWRVLDVTTGRDQGFSLFKPSRLWDFAIASFSQYAQSHRLWSPDGRYLVYAEQDRQRQDNIWLVDTWAESSNDATFVDQGSLAFWSFN